MVFVMIHAIRHIRHDHPQSDWRNIHLVIIARFHTLSRKVHVGEVIQSAAQSQVVIEVTPVIGGHHFHNARLWDQKHR